MKRTIKRLVTAIFIFAILITTPGLYHAGDESRASEQKVVRVGMYHMTGFHYYDQLGELQGYCVDYLEMLAGFTGWKYEYVEVKDFSDGCEKLQNHEIDLLAPAMYTAERESLYDYSEYSFGTEYTILVANADNDAVFYEDYAKFGQMKVAVLKNYPLTDYFKNYMKKNNFFSELVYYDTIEESKQALKNGEVDAIVTSIMDMESDQKLLARFAPQSFYFLTWNGNSQFVNTLNKAMEQVQNTYPTLLEDLLVNHYPIYELQFFSREEMEFVKDCGTLRVAYVADRKPLSFMNEDGELDGISREIFDAVAELTGLQFEYVALPEGTISYEFLLEQKIDLVTGVEYNSTNLNANGMLLSTPYISSRKMIVSLNGFEYDTENSYRIAVPAGSQTVQKVLKTLYPNMQIIEYPNNAACFEALSNEEVDMLIQNQYVVEGILSKPQYSNFVVVPMEGLEDKLSFSTIISMYGMEGMSESESIRLITIINKALSQITEQEIDNMIVRETLENPYELDLLDFVYSYRWAIIAFSVAFVFMTLFFIAVAMIQKKHAQQKAEEARTRELERKRYKAILECSDDLIYEISLTGESNIGSDKIKEKFGWEIPKMVEELDFSKAMAILHIHPDDEPEFRKTLLNAGAGVSDELTVRIGKADGTYIWCKVSRSLLLDENHGVVSILGKIEDVDEEVRKHKELEHASRTDALSGLLNKITFKTEVKEYLLNDSSKNVGFVFIDMDHFKEVNDQLGHRMGDAVIRESARKIQLLFANFDLVSRFGGDEFCVFVKDIPKKTLEDKLKFAVEKMDEDYSNEGKTVHLSASIGAAYSTKECVEYRELLEVADAALYKAKDNGRNCYVIDEI